MYEISPINAFNDNYIWCITHTESRRAIIVDPGDAKPVEDYLAQQQLELEAILITHHHPDHIGGMSQLKQRFGCKVIGFLHANYQGVDVAVTGQDEFECLNLQFRVLEVPGHTLDHIAFLAPMQNGLKHPLLFCGDTLFSAGCGRLFEGSPAMMLASLTKLEQLPDETRFYCAHEYTMANLAFARSVLPDNAALNSYHRQCKLLREQGQPTLPGSLATEKKVNLFLQSDSAELKKALQASSNKELLTELEVFTALRRAKDQF